MDNQQVDQAELGWLAGAMDGEGHIGMHVYPNKRKGNTLRIEVAFTNCSPAFLEKCVRVCRKLGANLHIQAKSRGKAHWAPAYTARTGKISHCKRILEQILPYLTSKEARARLLLEFCERRLDLYTDAEVLTPSKAKKYTEKDMWYFNEFKKFRRSPAEETPTTIPSGSSFQEEAKRAAPANLGDDIV